MNKSVERFEMLKETVASPKMEPSPFQQDTKKSIFRDVSGSCSFEKNTAGVSPRQHSVALSPIDFEEARSQLSQSCIPYASFFRNGKSEWATFNENLAKSRAQSDNTTVARALRRITKEEKQRNHNTIMSTVYRKLCNKRLDTVPVCHNGDWREVT